ncbi:hypothetical protein EVAR_3315_1 [Eumeta japonica]|uniref:Uncharacterized protein n=1 Tax=Eumeta variegata TaxID=151549 RepID=A0A4C1SVY5_EUMVA|nr:hypothetical protein EVAR_3315_1 [Eumeta japonica]
MAGSFKSRQPHRYSRTVFTIAWRRSGNGLVYVLHPVYELRYSTAPRPTVGTQNLHCRPPRRIYQIDKLHALRYYSREISRVGRQEYGGRRPTHAPGYLCDELAPQPPHTRLGARGARRQLYVTTSMHRCIDRCTGIKGY